MSETKKAQKNILADSVQEDASFVANPYTFLLILFLIIITLLLATPKIYLANEIYYNSKELQKLKIQAQSLQEEQIILERKIEKMKFQNSVIHTMF